MDSIEYNPEKHTIMPGTGQNSELYLEDDGSLEMGEMLLLEIPVMMSLAFPNLLPQEMFEVYGRSEGKLICRRLVI